MSVSTKAHVRWVQVLLGYLRGNHVSGVCGLAANRPLWDDAFLLWSAMLLDTRIDGSRLKLEDLLYLHSEGEATLREMKQLILALRSFEPKAGIRYRNFKRSYLHTHAGAERLLQLLEPHIRQFFLAPSARTLLPLNDLLSFMLKLTLKSDGLEQEAIAKFRSSDDIIVEATDSEIRDVNRILKGWLEGFQPNLEFGFHGPGASAGLTRRDSYPDSKYDRLFATPLLKYAGFPVGDLPLVQEEDAEVVFVPKSFDSLRTICKVPAGYMYWQQGVQRQLYAYVDRTLHRHVYFADQSRSRTLAIKGSRDGSYYTIDLSSASDTIAWGLVKRVFRGTSLLRILYATRSKRYRLPDGTFLVPKKSDPMGSALTFPVESLLFAAICESCAVVKKPRFRVYGDDIVCHAKDIPAEVLIDRLTRFGFKVNREKSYTSSPFREACGVEAYWGEVVTPIRLSRQFRGLTANPATLDGLRELANALFWRDYKYTRLVVLRNVLDHYGSNICFDYEETGDRWLSLAASNYQLAVRWNKHLQRMEFPEIRVLQKRSRGCEENLWTTWWSTRLFQEFVLPAHTGREYQLSEFPQELAGGGAIRTRRRKVWKPF